MTSHLINSEDKTSLSLEELANEFRLIQSGSKRISIFGTRNLPITHQQIVEILASSLAEAGNIIVTSGGVSGVNFATIQGTLRHHAHKLEVVLPQTIAQQSPEVQESLKQVNLVVEHPERLEMEFAEASRICYNEIIDTTHQLICFLYHNSNTLKKAIEYAKLNHKIVTAFYLD